jgi:hypothetical protein
MAVRSGGGELATRAWTVGHWCQLVGQRGAPCLCGACGGGGSEGGRRELSVWRCKRRRKAGGVTLRRRSSTWCLGSQTQHAWGGGVRDWQMRRLPAVLQARRSTMDCWRRHPVQEEARQCEEEEARRCEGKWIFLLVEATGKQSGAQQCGDYGGRWC